MVLAEGVELDILHDDHLLVVLVEHGASKDFFRLKIVAIGEEKHRLCNTFRALNQAFTCRIFTQQFKYGFIVLRHLGDTFLIVFVNL